MLVKIAQIPENIMPHYAFLLTFQRDQVLLSGLVVNLINMRVVFGVIRLLECCTGETFKEENQKKMPWNTTEIYWNVKKIKGHFVWRRKRE